MCSTSISIKCFIFCTGLNAFFGAFSIFIGLKADSENTVYVFPCFNNPDVRNADFLVSENRRNFRDDPGMVGDIDIKIVKGRNRAFLPQRQTVAVFLGLPKNSNSPSASSFSIKDWILSSSNFHSSNRSNILSLLCKRISRHIAGLLEAILVISRKPLRQNA